ncbi:ABC transporter permease [Sphingobium subterraneum]|uniref:ABC-2 type transport system permease protein n=1 Tax=Sphingobium subterraneum TaxID=627688 RepID=A0A841IVC5_9SPHN|nr:ABC transporter permease [Sphingobium subterraneum]MBB6122869.1 ABC-2 type transport system permease protein [Sphingobium subterraneum]
MTIPGWIRRSGAIFLKELTQMRRDRLTFAAMLAIPVIQLVFFGYAINSDPRHLPTAVHAEDSSPIVRSLLHGFQNSGYFDLSRTCDALPDCDHLLSSGEVTFVIHIPVGFTAALVAGRRPELLIEADASDPVAASSALGYAESIVSSALRNDLTGSLAGLQVGREPYGLVIHPRYNPEKKTQYNIIPGLLGVILTMTLVMITAIGMTREVERGTMENLLVLPARPGEVMIGKIAPYLGIGAVQTVLILIAANFLFGVPFSGSVEILALGLINFALANLALGFSFSTIARTQLQAIQMTFLFFLPSILLSGFMFPFRGMPGWARGIGELLPLTHFLRVVRGVMLKDASIRDLQTDFLALLAFTIFVTGIAMFRYRRTMD